jgi:hypothetical protein
VADFALEVWKSKAADRAARAPRALKAKAARRLKRDTRFINGLSVIIEWCQKQGYAVTFGKTPNGGILDTANKSIQINCHLTPENQVYNLAHECGHILIGTREKDQRFGMGYTADEPNEKKTLVHRIDVVDEEFEAWERGRKLAGRLGVRIDKKSFHRARAQYIKTYMKWALQVDGHGGPLSGNDSET